jgi:hypothetical protein
MLQIEVCEIYGTGVAKSVLWHDAGHKETTRG